MNTLFFLLSIVLQLIIRFQRHINFKKSNRKTFISTFLRHNTQWSYSSLTMLIMHIIFSGTCNILNKVYRTCNPNIQQSQWEPKEKLRGWRYSCWLFTQSKDYALTNGSSVYDHDINAHVRSLKIIHTHFKPCILAEELKI